MRALMLAALTALTCVPAALAQAPLASTFPDLVAAANREGALNLSWSATTLGDGEGVRKHEARFNALFGTKIKLSYTPGIEAARLGNQVFTEYQAKQPASTDVYVGAAAQLLPLLQRDLFVKLNWAGLAAERQIEPKVEADGAAVRIGTAVSGVTYNSAMVAKPPKSLEEFLAPEWKGKIATTPYAAGFDILAADDIWGPDRAVAFVRKLTSQVGGLIRCGEAERIATGEYNALVMDCISNVTQLWQERGAPVAYGLVREAAQKRYYYAAIPKNAKAPNAAALFTIYLASAAGQEVVWDTIRMDLDSTPRSRMAEQIKSAEAEGLSFREVTIEWWAKHPEIDRAKAEMIKALSGGR